MKSMFRSLALLSRLTYLRYTLLGELFTNRRFVVGFTIFIGLVLFSYIGSLYAYPDPWDISIYVGSTICAYEYRYLPPSLGHPLGTDQGCRDIFTWLVVGLKNSLYIAVIAAMISTTIATILGLIAGYRGGLLDDIINFLANFLMVIPMFIVLLMLVSYIPPEARTSLLVAIVIGITSWPGPARVVRSMVMQHRSADYIDIAKLTNFSTIEIILKEILPNVASYIFLIYINSFSQAIFAEVGIGALGYGPWDAVTLGRTFNNIIGGGLIFVGAWWSFTTVGLVVVMLSYSLLLVNLGLQHVFNPRLKLTYYAV